MVVSFLAFQKDLVTCCDLHVDLPERS